MALVEPTKKTQTLGHCRKCDFQWVVIEGTKGKRFSHTTGQVCPFCNNASVRYTKEDAR